MINSRQIVEIINEEIKKVEKDDIRNALQKVKDRIEFLAELIGGPILKALHILDREQVVTQIAEHAGGRAQKAQIPQSLKRAQRVGIEFALVIDPAHARALNEVVGENFIPQIDHLLRFGKEAVAADIKTVSFVFNRAADPADIGSIAFDDRDRFALFGQQIACGKPGRTSTNNRHINIDNTRILSGLLRHL